MTENTFQNEAVLTASSTTHQQIEVSAFTDIQVVVEMPPSVSEENAYREISMGEKYPPTYESAAML